MVTWLATVFSLMISSWAIARSDTPRARSLRISSSRLVKPSDELDARRTRLHGGGVVVANRGAGLGDEETGLRDRVLGFVQSAANHGAGGGGPSLGESQQG